MKKNMNGFTDKVVRSGSFDDAHNGAVTVERPKVKAIGISPIQNIKPVPLSMTAPTRSNNSILSRYVKGKNLVFLGFVEEIYNPLLFLCVK
mmetsp:Transcript_37186/g.86708  ORF Transcript_37186/g.86708 Transcript_37186/m.86708 type:complete len:91 (+) Transcript_37186:164-436(+)